MSRLILFSFDGQRLRVSLGSVVLFVLMGCFTTTVYGQDRCGTVEYIKILREKNLIRENDKNFEQWLSRRKQGIGARSSTASVFKIPVVVHVIHNGEAVGSGSNISDAQIISQIKVLNNDFKRLNADTTETPDDFLFLAGKINFEFVLAKQSPQGTTTTGIVRVKGTKRQWSLDDNNVLKALSYWPAENYLNIWVTDITSTIMGYAQFPVSDLAGLEDAEDNRLTDGVVLDYRIVGSNEDGPFNLTTSFNKGRTATHEVGHFFGLRHIWGDDSGACHGGGDYVSDTPDQGNNTTGCPTHPQRSCSEKIMFQNYMDYTNDVCMNLYTKQQVERMLTVLENSPRRASLLVSDGLFDPGAVNNDLAIKAILSPSNNECMGSVVPKVTVVNKGLNNITSVKIRFTVADTLVETKNILLESLIPQAEVEISFSAFSLSGGTRDFWFEIIETNSTTDGKSNDNFKSLTTTVPYMIVTPFSENFNSLPQAWEIENEDGETSWSLVQTGAVKNSSNKAIYMNFFESEADTNEKDIITTPVMDLSSATSPFVAFDVAYGRYQLRSDGLEVYAMLDCNPDLIEANKIYSRYGSSLATVSTTTDAFSPLNETQWRREVIDLREFIGQAHVQLAFVGVNGKGNNLYIDNIAVRTDVTENIALREIINPTSVHCSNEVVSSLLVENNGPVPVSSLNVIYLVNDDSPQTFSTAEGFILSPGAQTTITLPAMMLDEGINTLSFKLNYPNGFGDIDTTDNHLLFTSVVNDGEDKIPSRQNFDDNQADSAWVIVNPTGQANWTKVFTNYNKSLSFTHEDAGIDEEASWFVSPILDFSAAASASLFFDFSFGHKNIDSIKDEGKAVFKVLISRNCGQTFEEILFSADTNILSENGGWGGIPATTSDWKRQYINLSDFAGESSVRVAFVVSNAVTGTLYIDNIEFFISDDPTPFASTDLYTLYPNKIEDTKSFYVTFNLNDRQTVTYELVDMLGKQVGAKELTDVLNQTYKVDVENASNGVYLVRLLIDKKYYVSRIVVAQ